MSPWILLVGCGTHHQSALHPAGPAAAEITWLTWVLIGGLSLVFLVTMALAAAALSRRRTDEAELGTGFVAVAGIVVPSIVLFGILFLALRTTLAVGPREGAVTIAIVGHQYWWDVRYPGGVIDANHLVLPAGVPVRLELRSADVIHSFWIPNLHGKMDMIPERTHTFWVQADAPGIWRGVCAEFCGTQHAKMAFTVHAVRADAFQDWLSSRVSAQHSTDHPGAAVFVDRGCAACHAVRGLSDAQLGPDLTHLASRPTLGAGALPNTPPDLHRWVRDPQRVKPGNLMPPAHLPDREMALLLDWLGGLR